MFESLGRAVAHRPRLTVAVWVVLTALGFALAVVGVHGECLFDRLSPGALVLLDDGARPGERVVARRWKKRWPQIEFARQPGSQGGDMITPATTSNGAGAATPIPSTTRRGGPCTGLSPSAFAPGAGSGSSWILTAP